MTAKIIQLFQNKNEDPVVDEVGREASTPMDYVGVVNTGAQYLAVCKKFLEEDDYHDLMCAILDEEYYESLEPQLQKLVQSYYSFGC